jgi:hypothetical protein
VCAEADDRRARIGAAYIPLATDCKLEPRAWLHLQLRERADCSGQHWLLSAYRS